MRLVFFFEVGKGGSCVKNRIMQPSDVFRYNPAKVSSMCSDPSLRRSYVHVLAQLQGGRTLKFPCKYFVNFSMIERLLKNAQHLFLV